MNRVTECRCEVEKVRGLWNVMLVVEYDGGEFCETERLELVEPAAGPAALGMAVETIATAAAQLADRHGIGQADCEWIDSLSALTDTEGRDE